MISDLQSGHIQNFTTLYTVEELLSLSDQIGRNNKRT